MDQIYSYLTKIIIQIIKDFGVTIDPALIRIERTANPDHGDISTNVALVCFSDISKATHAKNPLEAASLIVNKLKIVRSINQKIRTIEAAPPGFINFTLNPAIYWNVVSDIIRSGNRYGSSTEENGKTLIIDYSAPNIAKRFSIGHLRSTIIGDSLKRLYEHLGWKVIGDNHLGDWGTQFGKMIVAIRKWTDGNIKKMTIAELEKLYVKFHEEAEKDPALNDEARLAFKLLEDGKHEERKMWKELFDVSMREFNEIYQALDVHIDVAIGESFYEDIMPGIICEAKRKKIAVKSKGAYIIKYPGDALPPSILVKSDGATTYLTRDLATIKYRKEKWNPDRIVYEVGAEQQLHFKQLFWAAELLGYTKRNILVHVAHGMVRLAEGRMSTRKGRTIKLEEVLTKAIEQAGKFTKDKKLATIIGIGAVKYNDLKRSPSIGYTFDWDEALNLEGNSGPYLQYTYVRCKSVIAKTTKSSQKIITISGYTFNSEELMILKELSKFDQIIKDAASRYTPNLLCNYLFELSQAFNTFYNSHSILNAQSQTARTVRLEITQAVMQLLSLGLSILGIKTPQKM